MKNEQKKKIAGAACAAAISDMEAIIDEYTDSICKRIRGYGTNNQMICAGRITKSESRELSDRFIVAARDLGHIIKGEIVEIAVKERDRK